MTLARLQAPPLLHELATEKSWQLTTHPLSALPSATRLDYLAVSPSRALCLMATREAGQAELYTLIGRHAEQHDKRWQLSAEAPPPEALHAAVASAERPHAPHPRLGRLLRAAGWRCEAWNVNNEHGTRTYISPKLTNPVRASLIVRDDGNCAYWSIALPGLHPASASPDIPGRVLSAFLLTAAAVNP